MIIRFSPCVPMTESNRDTGTEHPSELTERRQAKAGDQRNKPTAI